MVLGWNVPASPGFCIAHRQNVTCDFNNPQPLQPNYDVVSKAWWGAFLTTAWSACVVSIALVICEYVLWRRLASPEPDERSSKNSPRHHKVQRCIHILESLINAFSDQQSVAGLSLIVVAGHNGCELSAYIYNLICFQLIMSMISHLNALTNTRNWFGGKEQEFWRGIFNGIVKIIPIGITILMTGIFLGARIGGNFPSYAGQLASFPASCFENTNYAAGADEIHSAIFQGHRGAWASNGFVQYMILVLDLVVVGFIFTFAILKRIKRRPDGYRVRISLILRTFSTFATTGTLAWLSTQYILMRKTMESNSDWYYSSGSSSQYSYYNIVTWGLFASSLIVIAKAFAEAFKNDEELNSKVMQRSLSKVTKDQDRVDKYSTGNPTVVTEIFNSPVPEFEFGH